jgi:hypothetical protein
MLGFSMEMNHPAIGVPPIHGNHVTCSGGHRIHGDIGDTGNIDDLGLGWLMDSLK